MVTRVNDVLGVFFPVFLSRFVVICTSILSLSICSSTASTAQRRTVQRNHPCTKQQTKYVLIRVYIRKQVCTYMHAAFGLFSWSKEPLLFASRLFAPEMLDHLRHRSFSSIPPCERAFSRSMELLAFASRLFAREMLERLLLHLSFCSILPCARA